MLTRRAATAAARKEEDSLKRSLLELKKQRQLCEELLRERVDSEQEIDSLNEKYKCLKKEMVELDLQLMDMVDQRDKLQLLVESFHDCSDTHQAVLSRVNDLEKELNEAHMHINTLQCELSVLKTKQTQGLFEDLIGPSAVRDNAKEEIVTIDLTNVSDCSKSGSSGNFLFTSRKKIKKYMKLNRFLAKKNLLLKKSNLFHCIRQLRRDKKQSHDEMGSLEDRFRDIQCRYEEAQRQILEHVATADQILELSKYNEDRFLSLMSKTEQVCCYNETTTSLSVPSIQSDKCPVTVKNTEESQTFIYSDRLGVGLGQLLNNMLDQKVTNVCYPDATLDYIVDCVKNSTYTTQTTIVLLLGNSKKIRKKDIVCSYDKLSTLKVKRIIWCALPYSGMLSSRQNSTIQVLNNCIYNLTNHNSDNLFTFFDTNKFIRNIYLTGDTMYLQKKYKRSLATLLAYNINNISNATNNIYVGDSTFPCYINKHVVQTNLNC